MKYSVVYCKRCFNRYIKAKKDVTTTGMCCSHGAKFIDDINLCIVTIDLVLV